MKKQFAINSLLMIFALLTISVPRITIAQTAAPVACGDKNLPARFTTNGQILKFLLNVPGDGFKIKASVKPTGQTLRILMKVFDSDTNFISQSGFELAPSVETPVLASLGDYVISIENQNTGRGPFELTIQCIGPGGSDYVAGQSTGSAPIEAPPSAPPTVEAPAADFFGFPGLDQIPFDVAPNQIELGKLISSPLPANARPGAIAGYTFSVAKATDIIELKLKHKSGNMNVGVAVISANNTTYYFSTLTAASDLTARFKVDTPGEYTLGLFRIDLVPPKKLEKTVIEIQVNINPK